MKIDILTLFPEMFTPLKTSIIGRAVDSGKLEINIIDIRNYTLDNHSSATTKRRIIAFFMLI